MHYVSPSPRQRTRRVEALKHRASEGRDQWAKIQLSDGLITRFNPWLGCTKVSEACRNCYAESWAKRSGLVQWGESAERRRTSAANWRQPIKWNREARIAGVRKRVFCASLADVFEDRDELIPWRTDLFSLIHDTPNLDWLLLTKRPENIVRFMAFGLKENVWLGTTVEGQSETARIDHLTLNRKFARVLFLSVEPMLGPLNIEMWACYCPVKCDNAGLNCVEHGYVDWVICGGESGPNHRLLNLDHVRGLRNQCAEAGVPFFFKQHGGRIPDAGGCLLDGVEHKEFPKVV